MELVSSNVEPAEFFLEPLQYVFRDGDADWVVSFIPTVPHGCEAEQLHGDLFDCRVRDITYDTAPIPIGSDAELTVIDRLQRFADAHKTKDEQQSLRFAKYPRMDGEMVGWRFLLWFIGALQTRRAGRTTPHTRKDPASMPDTPSDSLPTTGVSQWSLAVRRFPLRSGRRRPCFLLAARDQ